MAKFVWQDGTLVSKAKVEVGGNIYEVDPEEYSGSTPLSASNLNAMVNNIYDDMTKSEVYSTTETAIGTWLGKTLYRKVIRIDSMPDNAQKNIAHGITNLDAVIYLGGYYTNGSNTFMLPSVRANSGYMTAYQAGIWATSTDIVVETATNRTSYNGYAIIEYTKN